VATTIGSAFLALISLMLDAWGQAEALVAFERWSFARCRRKVLWTIVLGLNPIVGTFYVLQTMVVTWKFRARLRKQRKENGNHSYEVAKAIADSWVAVGVAKDTTIPDIYKMSPGMPVYPDPDLVLYLAGTGDPRRVEGTGDPRRVEDTGHTRRNTRAWPEGSSFHFFLLNYEGMAALLRNDVLANVDYRQLRFLGRRTLLETVIIILQAISYIIAVVYRRAKHLHVSPVEGIGFTWSLLVVVDTFVQYFLGSRSQQALLIYLTPRQEDMIHDIDKNTKYGDGIDSGPWEWILTFFVGFVVAGVATIPVLPVLAKKHTVYMVGHIMFFGDFVLQFIFLLMYRKKCCGSHVDPDILLRLLVFPGIIASAGVVLIIIATKQHWHDEQFDNPTPSLGRYFPFIG
jgi:hypothetical protein